MTEPKSLQHQSAAYRSWANTEDWSARTSKARNTFENKFLEENDGDPKRAAAARKAYFIELTRRSVDARKRRRENGAA